MEGLDMPWFLLSLAIVAEVVATSFLRASEGFSRLTPSLVVIIGYAAAFYLLSLTLKSISVGVAYAIWSGAGIVLVAGIGWFAFGQKLDVPAVLGMGMIIAGVIVINVFSTTVAN
jgi:small multidrug resistance pump